MQTERSNQCHVEEQPQRCKSIPTYFKTLLKNNGLKSADLGHTNLSKNHNLATASNK